MPEFVHILVEIHSSAPLDNRVDLLLIKSLLVPLFQPARRIWHPKHTMRHIYNQHGPKQTSALLLYTSLSWGLRPLLLARAASRWPRLWSQKSSGYNQKGSSADSCSALRSPAAPRPCWCGFCSVRKKWKIETTRQGTALFIINKILLKTNLFKDFLPYIFWDPVRCVHMEPDLCFWTDYGLRYHETHKKNCYKQSNRKSSS